MLGEDNKMTEPLGDKPPAKVEDQDRNETDEVKSQRAYIAQWQEKIKKAKKKWDSDFERMRDNMDFVAGLQWNGQTQIRCPQYVVNLTLRAVNQGVAMLYARNPRVVANRRPRLDFQIWDEKMETLMPAVMFQQMAAQAGALPPPQVMALLMDVQQGMTRRMLINKVAKTWEYVYQYQMDSQCPRFKVQMKQLVRRVRVCGVGYIRVHFCRDYESDITQSETKAVLPDRVKVARAILEKLADGKIEATSAEVEKLKQLVASLGVDQLDYEAVKMREHLVFDFPRATSIIPDPCTRTLKGLVGCRWIVEEQFLPLSFVNAFFEKDIKPGTTEVKTYNQDNKVDEGHVSPEKNLDTSKQKVCLWIVTDLDTKSEFIICEGYKDYILEPETVSPATKNFWNLVPVTFNDIEVEEGCKATIFPPSDVDLIFSAQKEWNRTRQALRRHRQANGPKYMYPDGALDDDDLDRLSVAEDQEMVKLKGLQPGVEPNKVFQPFPTVPIQPELYDTSALSEDALLATGQQEANIGPPQPNVTATGVSVAEQSKNTVAASDVDGLDDSLTDLAQCGGEMLFRDMSIDTVKKIAGPGAVWPLENKEDFLNELELEVVAASSGRPNQTVEINNWKQIAPLLMQAGANPQAVIRETVKRFDDRLDPEDFFPPPIPMGGQPDQQQATQENSPQGSIKKPKKLNQPPADAGNGS